jgi:hypothetical protein
MNEQNERANVKTVQQFYEAVRVLNGKSADAQPLLRLCADDVSWHVPEMESVRICGKRSGHESVKEFFTAMAHDYDVLRFEPREFIAQGDTVVALGHYAWRVKATGNDFSSDWAHVFALRDGKIVRFQEYMDTAAEAKAHEKRRAKEGA